MCLRWLCHRGQAINDRYASHRKWLHVNCPEFIIKNQWAPNSPDINPMDYHVWGVMFFRLITSFVQCLNQLLNSKKRCRWSGTACYNNNNNNNNTRTIYIVLSSWPQAIARVHSVHLMNIEQRQAAADPQTKPSDLGCESACRQLSSTTTIAIYYYLLLSPKADTRLPSHVV